MKKVILDLCGGTGAWSAPYKENGYEVINVTSPIYDVRFYDPGCEVYGILAAPPCTEFSLARTKAKYPRNLMGAMQIVGGCLRIIWKCQRTQKISSKKTTLKFWALENPNGLLKYFLGKPAFEFDPWEFGDNYKKRTHLWGWFNEPKKTVFVEPKLPKFGSDKDIKFRFDKEAKSITPRGFAEAFYEANK
jgi:site-specific DNA-cytosine methylase